MTVIALGLPIRWLSFSNCLFQYAECLTAAQAHSVNTVRSSRRPSLVIGLNVEVVHRFYHLGNNRAAGYVSLRGMYSVALSSRSISIPV